MHQAHNISMCLQRKLDIGYYQVLLRDLNFGLICSSDHAGSIDGLCPGLLAGNGEIIMSNWNWSVFWAGFWKGCAQASMVGVPILIIFWIGVWWMG